LTASTFSAQPIRSVADVVGNTNTIVLNGLER
jgi:hypothetical protein